MKFRWNMVFHIADTPRNRLVHVNTNDSTVSTVADINMSEPWDILYKDGLIYIANCSGAANYEILVYNTGLLLINNFGTNIGSDSDTLFFYGPKRFVVTLNKKITLIDETPGGIGGGSSFHHGRLVTFDPIDIESTWSSGMAGNYFNYYMVNP